MHINLSRPLRNANLGQEINLVKIKQERFGMHKMVKILIERWNRNSIHVIVKNLSPTFVYTANQVQSQLSVVADDKLLCSPVKQSDMLWERLLRTT